MRAAFVLLALLAAGCAAPAADEPAARWTFTERADGAEPATLATGEGWAQERALEAGAHARQVGGRYHGTLAQGVEVTLRVESSVPARVGYRVVAGPAVTSSGECSWGPEETAQKDVGVGRINMRNGDDWCEIRFTPSTDLRGDEDAPALQWEARARDAPAAAWSVRLVTR